MYKIISVDPLLVFNNGIIEENSLNELVEETNNAVSILNEGIGSDINTLVSSIYPMLGNLNGAIIPSVNYDSLITNLTQGFTINSNKEYVLSLIPNETLPFIINGESYTRITGSQFTSQNQYKLSGRILSLSNNPLTNFTITYSGYIPNDYGANINFQQFFPDPKLVENNDITKPTITVIDSATNTYSFIISKPSKISQIDGETPDLIQNKIPLILNEYISSTGSVETPLDYASLWILDSITNKYSKIELTSFKIISEDSFIIKTKLPIDINLTYIISLFAKDYKSIIEELYIAYKNHTHDDYGNTKRLSHTSLIVDNTLDNHPNYVKRTGYNQGDTNTPITGNILIGSTTETNNHSNLLTDSNFLVFGDYAFGHVIMRESGALGYLTIDSRDSNGINIIVKEPIGNNKYTAIKSYDLSIDIIQELGKAKKSTVIEGGNKLFLKGQEGVSIDKLLFHNLVGYDNFSINLNGVNFNNSTNGLTIETDPNKSLSIDGNIIFKNGIFEGMSVNRLVINEDKDILFLPSQDKLVSTVNGPKFTNKLLLSDYGRIGIFAEDNTTPVNSSNLMAIESSGGIYFINKISSSLTIDGIDYSFMETVAGKTRIDKIQDWPKQNIYARDANFKNIILPNSDFDKRTGILFGDTGRIYSSGEDPICSMDSIVIESKDDIIFLKLSNTSTDCDNKEFSNIRVGNINSNGDLTISGSISSDGTISSDDLSISSDASVGGSLNVDQEIRSNNIYANESIISKGPIEGTSLEIKGNGTIQNLKVDSSIEIGGSSSIRQDLVIGRNLSVEGNLIVNKNIETNGIIQSLGLKTTSIIVENIQINSDTSISGNLRTSSLRVDGVIEAGSEIVGSSLRVTNSINSESLSSKLISGVKLSISNDTTLGSLIVEGRASVNGELSIQENITVLKDIRSNGNITNGGDLTVSGTTKLSSDVSIAGDLKLNGNTNITGEISGGSLKITGNISSNGSIEVKNNLTTKDITVENKATFKTLDLETLNISKNITGTEETIISSGVINTGSLTLAARDGKEDTLTSYVKANFFSDLNVAGILSGGVIDTKNVVQINAGDENLEVYLTSKGLHFADKTAILGISKITTENLIGRVNIGYSELSAFSDNSAVANGIINAIDKSLFTVSDNLSVEGILNVPRTLVVGGTLYFNKIIPLDSNAGYVDLIAGAAVYG